MPRSEHAGVETVRVRDRLHQEIAAAQRPLFLVELGGGAVGQADLVGGIVECAGRPHRPVHEILAGVLGVGVAVENIDDGEFAGLQRQPRDVHLAGELGRPAGQFFLLAAEAEGLAHEQPRGVVMRVGEVGFLRLAARKARGADGVVQAKSLQQFGIVIDLAALPEPRVQKQAVAPGRLRLRRRRQAVGAGIGRTKRRIALRQVGGLAVDFPAIGFRIGQRGLRRQIARSRPVELAVEADAERLEIQRRRVLRARGKRTSARRTGCRDIPAARSSAARRRIPGRRRRPSRAGRSYAFLRCRSAGVLRKRSPAQARPPVA